VSKRTTMDQHLDIRMSEEQMTMLLQRVPVDVGTADWVRATLLAEPVRRGRVVRRTTYRDTTPYAERLRGDALLSLAATLGRLAGTVESAAAQREIHEVLGLVRQEILKGKPSC
jgi:hypothetical protein